MVTGSEEILLDRQKKKKKRVQVSSIISYMDYISIKKKILMNMGYILLKSL